MEFPLAARNEEYPLTSAPPSARPTDVRDDDNDKANMSGAANGQPDSPETPPRGPVGSSADDRRRKGVRWIALALLVPALLGATVAAVGRTMVGDQYTSEAQVLWDANAQRLLDSTIPAADANSMERQVTDQRAVMLSDVVIAAAAEPLRAEPDAVREAITVENTADSNVLTISSTSSSPDDAAAVVGAVAQAYVDHVKRSGVESLQKRADTLVVTIERLTRDLGEANAQLAAIRDPDDPAFLAAQGRADRVAARLSDLLEQQEAFGAAAGTYTGQAYLVQAATVPEVPSSWSLPTSILIGGALGLALGAGGLVLFRGRAVHDTGWPHRPAP